MSVLSWLFGNSRPLPVSAELVSVQLEEFRASASAAGFSIEVDEGAATIFHYRDAIGELLFAVDDIGFGGRDTVTLDWPRPAADWATHDRERLAFQRTKRFLEAHGFSVRVTPSEIKPNQPPEPTAMSVTPPAAQEPRQP